MRLAAFNGSPRGRGGNTHRMLSAFLEGAESAGATTEVFLLRDYNIKACHACYHCWEKQPGVCVHQDDVAFLLGRFLASDRVIFATPLYTDSMTALMKNFLERALLLLLDTPFEVVDGETRHLRRYDHNPDFVVLANASYPELSHFQVLSRLFHRLARQLDVRVAVEIFRTMGPLLTTRHAGVQPVVAAYLDQLREAGVRLVENGSVPAKLLDRLNQPLIPPEQYRERANAYWRKKRKSLS